MDTSLLNGVDSSRLEFDACMHTQMHLPPWPPNRSRTLPPSLHKQHSYSLFPTSMAHHWYCETRFVGRAHALRWYIFVYASAASRAYSCSAVADARLGLAWCPILLLLLLSFLFGICSSPQPAEATLPSTCMHSWGWMAFSYCEWHREWRRSTATPGNKDNHQSSRGQLQEVVWTYRNQTKRHHVSVDGRLGWL